MESASDLGERGEAMREHNKMNRRTIIAGLAAAPAAAGIATAAAAKSAPLPPVTIYHLEGRRSERAVWLFEELGWPYKLVFKPGDLTGSMANIRAISPIVPMAPTLQYGDQVLVESGAIMETLINRHAPGKLQPALNSPDYPFHMIFMHYAEGSLASRLFSDYRAWQIQPPVQRSPLVDSEAVVQYADEHLGKHPWFGGAAFSTADIMMKFPLDVATNLNLVDREQFPNVATWKKKIEARPAYIRMRAKALPNGMVGNLTPLPKHAPSGPRQPPRPAAK
jgi:glutathione S-transferase